MKTIGIKKDNIFIITFSVFIIFLFLLSYYSNSKEEYYMYIMMPWIFLFFLLEIAIFFVVKKVHLYDFGAWFVILSNFFMFGRFINYNFNLEDNIYINEKLYTNIDLLNTTLYLILAIYFFTLGYCIFYKKIPKRKFKKQSIDSIYFGIILLAIGLPFRLYTDVVTIRFLSTVNSYTGFSNFAVPGIFYSLASLAVPGIIFLVSSKKIKYKKAIMSLTVLYLIITMVLTGSRKQQIFDILTLVLYYITVLKGKLKLTSCIIYGSLGYIFLDLIYIIREYRTNLAIIPMEFFNSLITFDIFSKILSETLGEIGIIFYSVSNIIHCVPNIFEYQYGMTFIRTLPIFLPINFLVGDFFELASSTNLINKYMGMPAGSSLFGDLYWNFGILGGIIFAFFMGSIFAKLFSNYMINISKNSIYSAFYFSMFSILMVLVRAELVDCWRTIVYFYFLSFVMNNCKKVKRKER